MIPWCKEHKTFLLLALLAAYICFIGNNFLAITDPVESNYAETASEMIRAHDYLSPRIFGNYWYDKPIFFYWELIAAFHLWGTSEFAARFFPALFGIGGILLAYGFTKRIYDKKTAIVTALVVSLKYICYKKQKEKASLCYD